MYTRMRFIYIIHLGLILFLQNLKTVSTIYKLILQLLYKNHIFTGMADANNESLPIKEAIKDALKIRYFDGHLRYLLKAIR